MAAKSTNTTPKHEQGPTTFQAPKPRSQYQAENAKRRDGNMEILTNNMTGIDAAHILPYGMTSTSDGARLRVLIESEELPSSTWNLLTPNCYVHRPYDKGLIAFRPERITKMIKDSEEIFHVHLSIHWLGENCHQMLRVCQAHREPNAGHVHIAGRVSRKRGNIGTFTMYTKGQRVADGTETEIGFPDLDDAQKMVDRLAMSWFMRMILFLAGGAGIPFGDPRDNEEQHDPRS
ncbi:hypothetical protein ISF_09239 [Cordyceps fumosorosea ARSEF 2679]|uniref:HNH nuclease domain-containing protein n=1 Tax=Cordyceps fumosorosea (strain ARSEF 2679) TaxID=1081104 RepID=A0A167LAR6_CORFA|nr:hypothetical protein ISF_09239 [Cordyceps fumosorosea ARSEF 2679]OAA52856.1 hypothetical protein ISF_09239 [Cordyceps fumosorosea ARSEF 2679]